MILIIHRCKLKLYRIRGVVLAPPSATDGYEQLSFLLLTMTSNVAWTSLSMLYNWFFALVLVFDIALSNFTWHYNSLFDCNNISDFLCVKDQKHINTARLSPFCCLHHWINVTKMWCYDIYDTGWHVCVV